MAPPCARDDDKPPANFENDDDSSELSEIDSDKVDVSDGDDSSDLSELDSDAVSTPERFRSDSPSRIATTTTTTTSSSSLSPSSFAALPLLRRHPRRSRRGFSMPINETDLSPSPPPKRQRVSRLTRAMEVVSGQASQHHGVPSRYLLSREPAELENTWPSQGMQPDDEPTHPHRIPGRSAPRASHPVRIPGKLGWPGFATTERVTFLSYPPADPAARRRIEAHIHDHLQEPKKETESWTELVEARTVEYPISTLRTQIEDAEQPSNGRAQYNGSDDRERGWWAVAESLGQTVAETKAKVAEWERVNKATGI